MRRISKIDTRSQATAYGGSAILFAVPFVAVGGYFALAGFRMIPLPGEANAPLWVIGCVGLVFAAAGLTLAGHGIRGVCNRRPVALDGVERHGEPWFADHPWDPRGVRDGAGLRALNDVWMTVVLAVFLAPFNWWAFRSGEGPLMVKLIVGLFDSILALVAGSSLHRLAQFVRYGHSRLEFRRFPFHPGGELRVAFSITRLERLTATLRFVEERWVTSGTGKDRTTRLEAYEHFREQREFQAPDGAPETEIVFAIPDRPEWVTALSGRPVRYWEMVVESERRGVDFRTTFPLPVYARS